MLAVPSTDVDFDCSDMVGRVLTICYRCLFYQPHFRYGCYSPYDMVMFYSNYYISFVFSICKNFTRNFAVCARKLHPRLKIYPRDEIPSNNLNIKCACFCVFFARINNTWVDLVSQFSRSAVGKSMMYFCFLP